MNSLEAYDIRDCRWNLYITQRNIFVPHTGNIKSSHSRRTIGRGRKIAFSLIVLVFVLACVELVLALVGIQPTSRRLDVSSGFSKQVPLFEESSVGGNDIQVRTSQQKRVWFNDQTFSMIPAPGVVRIFCLGGSTTYGRPYAHRTSFSGWLEEYLKLVDPDNAYEVINAGGISYGSARIAVVAEEVSRYSPDIVVLYTGHNEFLEKKTYAELLQTPEIQQSANNLLSHTRLHAFARQFLLGSPPLTAQKDLPADEVNTLLDQSVGPRAYHRDPAWHLQVHAEFEGNLKRIFAAFRECEMLVVTPASRLRGCDPFKSEFDAGIPPAERYRLQKSLADVRNEQRSGRWKAALQKSTELLAFAPDHAHLLQRHADSLYELDRFEEAAVFYRRARDNDICPLRAPTPIVQTLKRTCASMDVPMVDFDAFTFENAVNNIPDGNQFLDHVHPTVEYHGKIAELVVEDFLKRKTVTPGPDWTEENRRTIRKSMLSSISDTERALARRNLAKVLGWAGKLEESDQLVAEAALLLPNDNHTNRLAADAHARRGEFDQAIALYRKSLDGTPQRFAAHAGLGLCFLEVGDAVAAMKHLKIALRLRPNDIQARYNYANALLDLGDSRAAIRNYDAVLSLDPEFADAEKNCGLAFLAAGDTTAGVARLKRSVGLDPDNVDRQLDLGFVLLDLGELQAARSSFQYARGVTSDDHRALTGLGLLAAAEGKDDEALKLLEHAAEMSNGDPAVLFSLGHHCEKTGDVERAAEIYTRLSRNNPDFPQATERLRQLDRRLDGNTR